ncbi:MAG: exonuclease domain-containing protein [Eubacteriales bacterium]|nr:exonuclease domain-containing protein [Eubacteriales bacterium]
MREGRGKRLAKYVPDYVVFDLETTGVSPAKDAIIEISAVKVRNGAVTDTFSSLVNPGRTIPYAASAVNHITDEMVADAPDITMALPKFLDFAGNDVLVGHNIRSFDLLFLDRTAMQVTGKGIDNDYIDTLFMARNCLPMLSHHRLVDLAAYFGISSEGAHRALNDCLMNQKCFEEMAKLQKQIPTEVCPRCGGELVKRKGRFGQFFGCSNYPACRYTKNS